MDWDSANEQVYIAYKDAGNSDKGTFVTGTISGSNKRTITFSGETVFNNGSINSPSVTYNSNAQKPLVGYSDGAGKGVVVTGPSATSNLTAENYIGIAAEAIANGATGKVNVITGTNTGQTGLTTAQTYYVQGNGSLDTSPADPSVVAGTSISETQILIR